MPKNRRHKTSAGVTGRRRAELALTACGFFLAVVAYIWLLAPIASWSAVALLAAVLWSWHRRGETLDSLGLRPGQFARSLGLWRVLWILCAAAFLAVRWRELPGLHFLFRGALYFAWCVVQQLLYQSMTYAPLKQAVGRRAPAVGMSAAALAAVHAPNPILMPATLVWGAAAALLFDRSRSVWGLALMQVLLSSALLALAPPALSHRFRVGPSYYAGF